MNARTSRNKIRRRPRIWVVLLLAIIVLYFSRGLVLKGIGSFLVNEDYLQKADLIYLAKGSPDTAPFLAATLWREGLAPLILVPTENVAGNGESGPKTDGADPFPLLLAEAGIPSDFITVLPSDAGNVKEEVLSLRDYAEKNDIQSMIVVCEMFATRRFRWIMESEIGEREIRLQLAAAANTEYSTGDWWRCEQGFIRVLGEYLRLVHYIIYQ